MYCYTTVVPRLLLNLISMALYYTLMTKIHKKYYFALALCLKSG